jgi:hypothetical protein
MTWLRGMATLSADRAYRYLLTRRWGDGPAMCWIMLNPSTADASEDDPTIRRCIGFARREGCEAIQVVNLFALRASDPRELLASPDPVGPGGDGFLLARPLSACTVAAWGAQGSLRGRSAKVTAMLAGARLLCLGVTASGEPRHPLYVRGDAPLVPFSAIPVTVPARGLTFHGSAAGRSLTNQEGSC